LIFLLFGVIIEDIRLSYKYMKYKVHRLDVKSGITQEQLEQFLNLLKGEVISVLPNVKPTFQLMGATAKVDYLLIVEKISK
jgi:hypothetical protein